MEPVDPFQMKSCNLESKLQVVVRKCLASSSVYYFILTWLIRIVVFVLWIGKGLLIWVLTFSFSLIRECTQKYLSVALVSFALTPQRAIESGHDDTKRTGGEENEERVEEGGCEEEEDVKTSPLLPIVLRDRLQICKENLAFEDR